MELLPLDLNVREPMLPPPPVPVRDGIPAYGLVGSPLSGGWRPTPREAAFGFGGLAVGLLLGVTVAHRWLMGRQ